MDWIESVARAMAEFEGYFKPGSRAARNHNPGNIRDFPSGSGRRIWPQYPIDDKGFVMFPDAETGWAKLRGQIKLDMVTRGKTLSEFIHKYAPSSDANPTENYIAFVSSRSGVDPGGAASSGDSSPLAWPPPQGPRGGGQALSDDVLIGAALVAGVSVLWIVFG